MPLTGEEKRALMARANGIHTHSLVGKAGLTEAVLAQIRALYETTDLLKIRLPRGDGDEAQRIAEQIASKTPCELVERRGFTATFLRAGGSKNDE